MCQINALSTIHLKRCCWGQWFGTFFVKLDKVRQTFWDQATFTIYTSWFQFLIRISCWFCLCFATENQMDLTSQIFNFEYLSMYILLQLKFWLSIDLFIYQFIEFISSQKKVTIQAWVLFVFCSKTNLQKPYRENGSWRAVQKTRNELGSSRAVNLCLACAKTDFSGLPKITELPPYRGSPPPYRGSPPLTWLILTA